MRFATCNEMFQGWSWRHTCAAVSAAGYGGIEIAPFTFCDDVRSLDASARAEMRDVAARAGLEICGLHWLLVKPEGLELLSPSAEVRATARDYLLALVDLAGDVGMPGATLTLGSPAQRRIPAGMSREQALSLLREALLPVGDRALQRGVKLCLEPLPTGMTNIMNTAAETRQVVDFIGHLGIGMMLDVKSMCAEVRPPADTIMEMAGAFSHFHANDANMRGPGTGNVDFVPILGALRGVGYHGYVSVEVFDYSPDPVTIARESLAYLKRCSEE